MGDSPFFLCFGYQSLCLCRIVSHSSRVMAKASYSLPFGSENDLIFFIPLAMAVRQDASLEWFM